METEKDYEKRMSEELNQKLEVGYKRLSYVSIVWSLIGIIPTIIFINSKYITFYSFLLFIWVFIGIFVSPKIVMKIWGK